MGAYGADAIMNPYAVKISAFGVIHCMLARNFMTAVVVTDSKAVCCYRLCLPPQYRRCEGCERRSVTYTSIDAEQAVQPGSWWTSRFCLFQILPFWASPHVAVCRCHDTRGASHEGSGESDEAAIAKD